MPGSLLLAKISLLGLLATFLPLFCGVRRLRLWLFAGMLGFFVLVVASALPVVSRSHAGFAGHTALLAAGGLVALLLLASSTWLAWRHPLWAVPVLLLLMPVRVPVPLGGGSTSNLLVPLYLATLAVAIAEFGIRDRLRLYAWFRRDATRVALAAFTAVAGVSSLWVGMHYAPHTTAFAAALVKLFAFFLPFAVIYYLVYRHVRGEREVRFLVGTIVGWGGMLAVVGMVQYATRTVFFNRASILHEYKLEHVFRVNALFWDPNMYGRFLVVVIILALASALALGGGHLRMPAAGAEREGASSRDHVWRLVLLAVAAVAALALFLTFSRSSWLGLMSAAVLFEFVWLRGRKSLVAVLVTVLILGGATFGAVQLRGGRLAEKKLTTLAGWDKLTGGRAYLVRGGWLMFRRHPQGIGLAGFPLAYHDYRQYHRVTGGLIRPLGPAALTESHSTPVTVLAEQGVAGIATFAAIIVIYFGTALRTARLREDQRLRLLQAGFMAVVLAILLHSCLYNAFFEDPYLWTIMAMSMALRHVVAQGAEGAEGAEYAAGVERVGAADGVEVADRGEASGAAASTRHVETARHDGGQRDAERVEDELPPVVPSL